MKVVLIRHARTHGNIEKRYIGKTDEQLCSGGVKQAKALFERGNLPRPDALIVSPYFRCTQTAQILYPDTAYEIYNDLRECDFGLFEGKTHADLIDNKWYTSWLAADCMSDIPGGESVAGFKRRCHTAFVESIRAKSDDSTVVFVIHGGCIMAILERFSQPQRDFQEYYVDNCEMVECSVVRLQNDDILLKILQNDSVLRVKSSIKVILTKPLEF